MKRASRLSPTDMADLLLCRPVFGIPFFLAVLSLVFFLSFCGTAQALADRLLSVLLRWGDAASDTLCEIGVSALVVRYLIGGVYTAVASALAFLPQTLIFFTLMCALDGSGYLARAVFATDRFFHIFGLSGNAVIPLILGYGCAVSSARACSDEPRERKAVLRALPLIPCSARLPVLLFLADAFFPTDKVLFCIFILFLSFVLVFFSLLVSSGGSADAPMLIKELPPFRFPDVRVLLREAAAIAREYLIRAATAVFLCCTVFSGLALLTPRLQPIADGTQSLLYLLAEQLSPVFRPLGFDRPEMTAALIFGFFAKENIVCVLRLLAENDLSSMLSPAGAAAFTAFSVFYTPCAFLTCACAEIEGKRRAVTLLFHSFALAYALSLILYTLLHILVTHC